MKNRIKLKSNRTMKKINLSWKLFGQGMENFGENGARLGCHARSGR